MSNQGEFSTRRGSIDQRERCSICSGALLAAIELPALPLTDTFCLTPVQEAFKQPELFRSAAALSIVDQRLLYCQACGHGQLQNLIAPEQLYGSHYCFRSSASATARKGTDFFMAVLDEVASDRRFRCALDLGCNDLYLLGRLASRAELRVGIDPVWGGREDERADKSILLFGKNVDAVDLNALPEKPDLIVCRHTLEHLVEPRQVVESLMNSAADDALFIFEVPGFDGLLERLRFDQVFHQHAQYFTLASFLRLLDGVGGRYLLHRYNYHDWGAMAVVFARGKTAAQPEARRWLPAEIQSRYRLFQAQMRLSKEALDLHTDGIVYGYGAAQMLPVLGYHLGTDFGELVAVLDDDPAKDGLGYWNLPVKVMHSSHVGDLAQSTVLITAVDNVQGIMQKLLSQRPRHIIYPLSII